VLIQNRNNVQMAVVLTPTKQATQSVMAKCAKEFYKRRERSERPDRFVSNGNYRILFRSLSEALQIAKCFE
jgi:hypothetical protein